MRKILLVEKIIIDSFTNHSTTHISSTGLQAAYDSINMPELTAEDLALLQSAPSQSDISTKMPTPRRTHLARARYNARTAPNLPFRWCQSIDVVYKIIFIALSDRLNELIY